MRSLFGYLFGWVVVLGLLALPAGVVMAGLGWWEARRIADVQASGATAEARIEGATRAAYGRRGRASYALNLTWRENGRAMRAEGVAISARLANEIIVDERIARSMVVVRYRPDDPRNAIVSEDADDLRGSHEEMTQGGIKLAAFGAIMTGLLLWRTRRRRSAVLAAGR